MQWRGDPHHRSDRATWEGKSVQDQRRYKRLLHWPLRRLQLKNESLKPPPGGFLLPGEHDAGINYQPMTTIRLHGQLRQFGKLYRLSVKSPAASSRCSGGAIIRAQIYAEDQMQDGYGRLAVASLGCFLNFDVRMYLPSIHSPLPTVANTTTKKKSNSFSPICSGVINAESVFTVVTNIYTVKIQTTTDTA